ncbi:sensor histidine kinase [Brooklawnia cerclae]|uniref:histidine kinase n=1 Tax=Brooklawnia cerclae TaxID=349934 RepID=A0ABX0SKE2_9ACTN|nr:sensor histidine kinase [Brooklawnia cerclae]NIH58794.1 signal transduction histidine kinase [Brooklawnia cerclae]
MTFSRIGAFMAAHPWVADLGLVLLLLPFVVGFQTSLANATQSEGWYVAWGVAYVVPLLWRRTNPDLAGLLLIVPHIVQLVVIDEFVIGNFVVLPIIHAVAKSSRHPNLWLAAGLVSSVLGGLDVVFGPQGFRGDPGDLRSALTLAGVDAAACALLVIVAWVFGRIDHHRQLAERSEGERAAVVERAQLQQRELAIQQERSRIARDMHDIVAHSLSLIVVQADGAGYLIDRPGDPEERLEAASRTLGVIRTTAHNALDETRRIVGVLRTDGESAELAPTVGLDDIAALVRNVRDAGLPVGFEVVGRPDDHAPLGAGAGTAAYRVVQEALTNVIKHAGPGAHATVQLRHTPAGLHIHVTDDGRGHDPVDGLGHGLIGMRERMAAFRGTLVARERAAGGFEVIADLPASEVGIAVDEEDNG